MNPTNTPLLLIAWRRPHTLRQVIDAIRPVAPSRLFVACDGPNPDSPGEWGYVVLRPTPGTFDAHGVTHPDVIYHDSQYWMYYYAMAVPDYVWIQIGLATSPDGVHWTKHNEPILMPGAHPWEDGSLYRASPVVVGDEIHLYYTGMSNFRAYPMQGSCEIGLAVSSRDRSTAQ